MPYGRPEVIQKIFPDGNVHLAKIDGNSLFSFASIQPLEKLTEVTALSFYGEQALMGNIEWHDPTSLLTMAFLPGDTEFMDLNDKIVNSDESMKNMVISLKATIQGTAPPPSGEEGPVL
jgi:hypothetical protein